jgi:predicted amino acid racemase
VTAPRLEIDLGAIEANSRSLVDRLAVRGIRVTGVTKATLGSPGVAAAMLSGGVTGIGDARVENLEHMGASGVAAPFTLIRSPMLSQVETVVRRATTSLNTEPSVLDRLSSAAVRQRTSHGVVLMVELGDLREGVAADELVDLARTVASRPGLVLAGIGTNLACQHGVVPDQSKMDQLSHLAEQVEVACGTGLAVVSGGNSANLGWALTTDDVGRIDDLRLGEAILLGLDPLHRRRIEGLRTDAFRLVAEVIEVNEKPGEPWGDLAQSAFGVTRVRGAGGGAVRRAILAVGRQDVDPHGISPSEGVTVLGASSDHLVVGVGDHDVVVGDELAFGLDYSALVRAATSPFVTALETRTGSADS